MNSSVHASRANNCTWDGFNAVTNNISYKDISTNKGPILRKQFKVRMHMNEMNDTIPVGQTEPSIK